MRRKSGYEDRVEDYMLTLPDITVEYEPDTFKYVRPAIDSRYTPDWKITTRKGTVFYIETKGRFMKQDRDKMILMKQQHPELDIRILFQQDNKLGKLLTHSGWARKYGFRYHIGERPPLDWFES